jgi:hypothetical protein
MNYPAVEKILKECETTDVENGYVYTLGVYTKTALPELRLLLANEKKLTQQIEEMKADADKWRQFSKPTSLEVEPK